LAESDRLILAGVIDESANTFGTRASR